MTVKIKKGSVFELLNITPLIDVVFQLLLFFLVATRFEQEDRELDVKLPAASEARPLVASARTLFVNIQHPGEGGNDPGDPAAARKRSTWPGGGGRPRSATVAIRRIDGGAIGT